MVLRHWSRFLAKDNWYEEGRNRLLGEICNSTICNVDDVIEVYEYLEKIGLIDYDVEKEVIWEKYYSEED